MTALGDLTGDLKQSAVSWSADGAPRLGAALAYYTLFSVSPLILLLISIAGLAFGEDAVRGDLMERLSRFINPDSARMVNDFVKTASHPSANIISSIIGFVVALFGATGFFAQLRDAFDTIWNLRQVKNEGILSTVWRYWWSISMILGTGFLLMVSLLLSTALSAAVSFATQYIAETGLILSALQLVADLLASAALFALIFKFIPDISLPWGIAWRGGFLTSILFLIGKNLLSIYLARSGFTSTYGAAGAVMVFLVWTYYSSQILLYGAEFTKILARKAPGRVAPAQGYEMADAAALP